LAWGARFEATLAQANANKLPPVVYRTVEGEGFRVEVLFASLKQGGVGVLRLSGQGVSEARALFRERQTPFFAEADGVYYALLVADIDAQPRDYPLQFLVALDDGRVVTAETLLTVVSGGFFRQSFTVPPDRAYLLNPEVERNEFARIDALVSGASPLRLWDEGGFQAPLESPVVSAFGLYRVLNATVQTRHTGWDNTAPIGTPVASVAAGRVVFAGMLDIRGNYVLIQHGWGVYSGYAHLSQANVAVGQSVTKGQIIGASGNTGRSSGPHLHWEINVNGEWVDCLDFVGIWLP
jgi:murein DD-endopeptidase MepM/ murein hydrolase activator NlpD